MACPISEGNTTVHIIQFRYILTWLAVPHFLECVFWVSFSFYPYLRISVIKNYNVGGHTVHIYLGIKYKLYYTIVSNVLSKRKEEISYRLQSTEPSNKKTSLSFAKNEWVTSYLKHFVKENCLHSST